MDEFKKNQDITWRRKINKVSYIVSTVILLIELITFVSYVLANRVSSPTIVSYISIKIIPPTVIDFGSCLILGWIIKKDTVSDNLKNYLITTNLFILCGVVITFHSFYFLLWMAPSIALFYCTVFNNTNIIKFGFVISFLEIFLSFFAARIDGYFNDAIVYSYTIVSFLFMTCEFLIAYKMVEHHILQQNFIFAEISKQNELIENLDFEPMTRLYNRKAFKKHLGNKLNLIQSDYYKNKLEKNVHEHYLMMFDLDYFKKINDTFGHINGDTVLIEVANILKDKIGNNGCTYRYGGEEFIAILEPCSKKDVIALAEEIRLSIKSLDFDFDSDCHITISIGISTYTEGLDAKEWLNNADQCLYLAKEGGRDRYVIH